MTFREINEICSEIIQNTLCWQKVASSRTKSYDSAFSSYYVLSCKVGWVVHTLLGDNVYKLE